jgi:hypothetical protein
VVMGAMSPVSWPRVLSVVAAHDANFAFSCAVEVEAGSVSAWSRTWTVCARVCAWVRVHSGESVLCGLAMASAGARCTYRVSRLRGMRLVPCPIGDSVNARRSLPLFGFPGFRSPEDHIVTRLRVTPTSTAICSRVFPTLARRN